MIKYIGRGLIELEKIMQKYQYLNFIDKVEGRYTFKTISKLSLNLFYEKLHSINQIGVGTNPAYDVPLSFIATEYEEFTGFNPSKDISKKISMLPDQKTKLRSEMSKCIDAISLFCRIVNFPDYITIENQFNTRMAEEDIIRNIDFRFFNKQDLEKINPNLKIIDEKSKILVYTNSEPVISTSFKRFSFKHPKINIDEIDVNKELIPQIKDIFDGKLTNKFDNSKEEILEMLKYCFIFPQQYDLSRSILYPIYEKNEELISISTLKSGEGEYYVNFKNLSFIVRKVNKKLLPVIFGYKNRKYCIAMGSDVPSNNEFRPTHLEYYFFDVTKIEIENWKEIEKNTQAIFVKKIPIDDETKNKIKETEDYKRIKESFLKTIMMARTEEEECYKFSRSEVEKYIESLPDSATIGDYGGEVIFSTSMHIPNKPFTRQEIKYTLKELKMGAIRRIGNSEYVSFLKKKLTPIFMEARNKKRVRDKYEFLSKKILEVLNNDKNFFGSRECRDYVTDCLVIFTIFRDSFKEIEDKICRCWIPREKLVKRLSKNLKKYDLNGDSHVFVILTFKYPIIIDLNGPLEIEDYPKIKDIIQDPNFEHWREKYKIPRFLGELNV